MSDELIIGVIVSIIAYIVMVFYTYDELEKPVALTELLFIPKSESIIWADSDGKSLVKMVSVIKMLPVINVIAVLVVFVLCVGYMLYIELWCLYDRISKKLSDKIVFK